MKKIRLLLITAVTLILLLAFSSCGTSSAKGVYKKINKAMSKLDSFSSETTITVSVNMNGEHADIDGYANALSEFDDERVCALSEKILVAAKGFEE